VQQRFHPLWGKLLSTRGVVRGKGLGLIPRRRNLGKALRPKQQVQRTITVVFDCQLGVDRKVMQLFPGLNRRVEADCPPASAIRTPIIAGKWRLS
jgi:hypothetical protein